MIFRATHTKFSYLRKGHLKKSPKLFQPQKHHIIYLRGSLSLLKENLKKMVPTFSSWKIIYCYRYNMFLTWIDCKKKLLEREAHGLLPPTSSGTIYSESVGYTRTTWTDCISCQARYFLHFLFWSFVDRDKNLRYNHLFIIYHTTADRRSKKGNYWSCATADYLTTKNLINIDDICWLQKLTSMNTGI